MSTISTAHCQSESTLQLVLERLWKEPGYLVAVTKYLLAEERKALLVSAPRLRSSAPPTRPTAQSEKLSTPRTQSRLPTLAQLLSEEASKRKRQETHYQGIPLSVITMNTNSSPGQRRVITSKRVSKLERALGKMGISTATSSRVSRVVAGSARR
jgi:hypothetical protein